MKKSGLLLLVALFTGFTACDSDDNLGNKGSGLAKAEKIELRLNEKVKTDNSFAIELFKTTYALADEANVFVSPLSVSMALNMVLNGAEGETQTEMLTALRASGYSIEQINEYSQSLREALTGVDPSTSLTIANSIWYRNGFSVKNDFIKTNRHYYNAEVSALDFNSPIALSTINGWCAKQTNNKINEILQEIPVDAKMYLINAIYFKGIWVSRFDKKNTRQEAFYLAEGSSNLVDMMWQTESFNYHLDTNCAYLELLYGNQAFSMILMLPNDGKTTDDVINALTDKSWTESTERMHGQKVNIRLPKFKAECKYKMHEKILPEMGMNIPFTGFADFSGMSDVPLSISEVIHKTFVEVNEEGTEAAAVTSVGMVATSVIGEPLIIDYIVNKPFLFAIRENSTGVIMFMGKMGKIK